MKEYSKHIDWGQVKITKDIMEGYVMPKWADVLDEKMDSWIDDKGKGKNQKVGGTLVGLLKAIDGKKGKKVQRWKGGEAGRKKEAKMAKRQEGELRQKGKDVNAARL
ncbi:hypothetical protein Tco_0977305 [Tanacetum coccineum]|uniref:Uncharacterized protein n=1 Tax=Tanacetum coccineum TaxID=301880 RepID=A0ABQ5EJR6_9ASTR